MDIYTYKHSKNKELIQENTDVLIINLTKTYIFNPSEKTINSDNFKVNYYKDMRISYKKNKKTWLKILNFKTIIIIYADKQSKYIFLLIDIFRKLANSYNRKMTYKGTLERRQ